MGAMGHWSVLVQFRQRRNGAGGVVHLEGGDREDKLGTGRSRYCKGVELRRRLTRSRAACDVNLSDRTRSQTVLGLTATKRRMRTGRGIPIVRSIVEGQSEAGLLGLAGGLRGVGWAARGHEIHGLGREDKKKGIPPMR